MTYKNVIAIQNQILTSNNPMEAAVLNSQVPVNFEKPIEPQNSMPTVQFFFKINYFQKKNRLMQKKLKCITGTCYSVYAYLIRVV